MEYASWEEYMDCEQVPLVNRMGEILARQGKHDKYSLEDVRLAETRARHESARHQLRYLPCHFADRAGCAGAGARIRL